MQLNIDFNIKSIHDKDTNSNKLSVSVDVNKSVLEHLTALEMAKQALANALEAYVKVMPKGMVTDKEYEELITTPLKKLKGFEV
ncbi:hypothetical protein [Sphingobacterium sp. UGAL515B_05]|uniref:hypothetical protein n=1 Tax=Sphingobacterium sp. UGAL515B_05 TaxID=2986767 RepID=UPI002952A3EC|nr:hypothetical protein [Sphingobacterium sp. UGAL515B_05]WON94743.1 hypothetical protein OK025_26345 [Sphingobacterium sp. UGAL515B_05]